MYIYKVNLYLKLNCLKYMLYGFCSYVSYFGFENDNIK